MKLSVFYKAFLAFIVTITVLELFLRWSGTSMPSLITDDDKLGRILLPNSNILLVNEGFYMGRVNQGGYLGRYYPIEKPNRCLRIAIVGDSYVAGFQLFDRYHFRTILEQHLKETCSDSIQVLNFGFAGFNFERMYIYYKLRICQYNPDFVIFVIGMDDLYEQDKKVGPCCIIKDNKLTIDFSFRDAKAFQVTKKFKFLRNTAFYSLNKKAMEMYSAGQTPEIIFDKVYNFFSSKKSIALKDTVVALTPDQESLSKAIFTELASEKNTRIIFAVKNHLSEDIRTFIHLPLYDFTDALNSLRDKGIDPTYWKATSRSGHWNYNAHQVIGLYLASVIQNILTSQTH